MARPLIVIPARLGATRLPRKPLADIAGEPMIVHVWRRAMAAEAGDVVVATDAPEIAAAIEAAGGTAIMTRADHQSGSDRVFEAVETLCSSAPGSAASGDVRGQFGGRPAQSADIIVNVQGDLPLLEPSLIRDCVAPLDDPAVDIGTLAVAIAEPSDAIEPSVVKVVGSPTGPDMMRALYFTRSPAPYGPGPLYHHIGIYAYRRAALARFVALPPSPLELRERLEQLRALEAGMRIGVKRVDVAPMSVDTPADLDKVRAAFAAAASTPRLIA